MQSGRIWGMVITLVLVMTIKQAVVRSGIFVFTLAFFRPMFRAARVERDRLTPYAVQHLYPL
jgi:hypothetical protein